MRITEVNGGHPVPSDLAVFDAGYPETSRRPWRRGLKENYKEDKWCCPATVTESRELSSAWAGSDQYLQNVQRGILQDTYTFYHSFQGKMRGQ